METWQTTITKKQSVSYSATDMGMLQVYDKTMQEQLQEGVIEPTPEQPTGEVIYYVSHQVVIHDEAEANKLRILYDCSARENSQQLSLNNCLETGRHFRHCYSISWCKTEWGSSA